MNFEELQVIWNTQDQRPLYTIDEAVVQSELFRHRQRLRRTWFRWNIVPAYVAGGMLGVLIAGNLLLVAMSTTIAHSWRAAALSIAAGVVLVFFIITVLRDQREERRREEKSPRSVREELEHGIARLEYEIRTGGGGSAGRKAIPLFVAVSLAMWGAADVTGASLWMPASAGLMLLGVPVELWRHHRRVTRDLLPRRRSLEALRAKLTDATAS
jgi:hypothetical protein